MDLTSEELWFDSWQEQDIFIFLKCPDQDLILFTEDWWINICMKRSRNLHSCSARVVPSILHFSKCKSLLAKMYKHVFANKLFVYSAVCTKIKILTVKTSQKGV